MLVVSPCRGQSDQLACSPLTPALALAHTPQHTLSRLGEEGGARLLCSGGVITKKIQSVVCLLPPSVLPQPSRYAALP